MSSRGRLGALGALGALGVSIVAAVALGSFAGCTDDPHRRTTPEQARGGGGACSAAPGEVPAANCDDSDGICIPKPGCAVDEATCGSAATCLPTGDNRGKGVLDFRIRRLNIATPEALASSFIQDTIVDLNIDMEALSCGERGKGLFTWLLRLDRASQTLLTGGAPPPNDAFGEGYCFARFELNGREVSPITTQVAFEGDTFRSTEALNVRIPIFLTQEIESVVVLPLSGVFLQDVTISDEGDCIGAFRAEALDSQCYEDKALCPKWTTGGALGGYITLEDAEEVKIRELSGKSLCTFLSGESTTTCARDGAGQIAFKGDYCSTSKSPGGCGDSVWLAATFAASATKIFDGEGVIDACSGVRSDVDAGADAGSDAGSTDAGSDDAGADGG